MSLSDIEKAAARQSSDRVVFEFDLPPEIAGTDDYIKKSVGMVKLKLSEETKCGERAGINVTALSYLFAKAALYEVDGRRLNKGEAEDDKVFDNCDPTIRQLILEAYADISTPSGGASKKFLASKKMKA